MNTSFGKNKYGILLMLIASLCVCTGQLFWKLSYSNGFSYLFIGFILYGLGAIIMIIAYKYGSLSVLQPLLSLNYVFTIILSILVLGERITPFKLIGTAVIILGVIFIAGGDE